MFKPSKYQQALFDEITNTNNNILVSAVAGSGKTTSIVESLKLIPKTKDVIFLAFNKSIVNELTERVPKHVEVSTIHSFGCKTLFRHYGKISISEDKLYSLAIKMSKDWNIPKSENLFAYCYRVRQLCDIMRQTLCTENEDEIFQLSLRYNIDVMYNEIEHAIKVVEKSNKNLESIDFVDMIYQLARKNLKTKRYDYVFIDEVQDLNRAQQQIVKKLIKPNGRFIGVGDQFQSIYGFAGADFESFYRMKHLMPNTVELPLSVCYRCGIDIVKKAQSIIPHIEYNPLQKQGLVKLDGKFSDIQVGDWVLCRNTKPLIMAFIQLLRDGKKANIKGREIGKGLVNLIQKTNKKDIKSLIKQLKVDRVRIKEKLLNKGVKNVNEHEKVIIFTEKIEIISILSDTVGGSVDKLIKYINTIFLDDDMPGVVLSTIHKSKGMEAKRVFIICAELLPSKYAKQPHEIAQEKNLEYVMITRAKEELIYIPSHEFNPDDVQREQIED
jgi:DNA helicase-2/ATP-dependent DNA helicase PcrA